MKGTEPMKIYLASSWRNRAAVNRVDALLSSAGHECFNFTNPGVHTELPNGFHWSEIDPDWQSGSPGEYRSALDHPIAKKGLRQDFAAMQWADACVAIQPFGRSASLELGWFIGQGKPSFLLLEHGEPELMMGLVTAMCTSDVELVETLAAWVLGEPIEGPGGKLTAKTLAA